MLVDDSLISFAFQISNGVPIKAYTRQQNDEELLFMVTFLEELVSFDDPRHHMSNTFCIRDLMKKHCRCRKRAATKKKAETNKKVGRNIEDTMKKENYKERYSIKLEKLKSLKERNTSLNESRISKLNESRASALRSSFKLSNLS